MEKIRLLVAEDETIIRMALVKLLEVYPNLFVVGDAKNGSELIEKYIEIKPDVVLCDISMPLINGWEASTKILGQNRSAKIILLTMHNEEEYLNRAIRIGIAGYVTKFLSEGELRYAIQTVFEGGKYYMGKTDKEIEEIKLIATELMIIMNCLKDFRFIHIWLFH